VEFVKNLAITSDQYHLVLDWELAEEILQVIMPKKGRRTRGRPGLPTA